MVYEIMGQIQNAVLGMIGTAGIVSYAAQKTPGFQERRQKQETIRQHKEALKEGNDTIRGTKAKKFEEALGAYKEFLDETGRKLSKAEYYDLLTAQREDFVTEWGAIAQEKAKQAVGSKTTIKDSVNNVRQMIKEEGMYYNGTDKKQR